MSASVSKSDDDAVVHGADDGATRTTGAIVSEGVLAGVIAASAVAVVFLVVDMISGQPFKTPQQLGGMLLSLFGGSGQSDGATPLALYTLFHFVAFMLAGILAAAIVQTSMKQPVALLLFVILFFAFEVIFTGFVAFLDTQSISAVTPYQVAIGNVVASIAMAIFFAARHPKLRRIGRDLNDSEDGS